MSTAPVAIVMGSDSDWPTMRAAATALDEFGVGWEARVLSAHRTPRTMLDWAGAAATRCAPAPASPPTTSPPACGATDGQHMTDRATT